MHVKKNNGKYSLIQDGGNMVKRRKEGRKEICLLVERGLDRKRERERERVCVCVLRVFVGPFIDVWARL
jgi:hypothetical protein